ncbi:hypothetical protein DFJ77DRAFT_294935 [Powellomyces hirtus]|nr:hypothetical protein DFJ77DRAFT_294935 [Powellomyces hirtus]
MGGFKMMKRTRGITQFEFMTLADGIRQIEENKEKRRTERRKKRRREARVALQEKIDQQRADQSEKTHDAKGDSKGESVDGALQGTKGDSVEKVPPEKKEVTAKQSEEEDLPPYAAPTNEKLDRIGNWVKITDSQRANLGKMDGDPAPVRVPPPVPSRPTAAELADMTEQRHLAATAPRKPQRKPSELSLTKLNGEAGHVWGLEEGFNWPDHEGQASEDPLDVGVDSGMDSTVLWDSNNQLNSDGESLARSSHEDLRFDKGSLDDVGTIDEDMAACMFDDLQSTVDGDNDEDFRFREPEGPPKAKQTNVLITVAGWITYGADDHTLPFSTLEADLAGDQYALIWETDTLQELGSALRLLVGEVASFLVQQGLQATVLSALMIGLAGPLWVMKLSYLVDNPWGIGLSKANKAGKVLADTLIQGVQENRPVTLIGYSLGARVIFHCLLELAARGAHGLVEEVYLLGCPVMAQKKEWEQISSVVAGRVVNGYATNDMVLGVLYRASVAVWNNVAGLRPVEGVDGIENIALDDVIQGHLDYRLCMPKVLEKLGFSITRDYFDDEDEEEEKERLELEEEKKREKEERLRAKEQRLQKKQEEYEEKLRKKKEEQERKLLERQERDKLKEEARLKRLEEKAAEAALAATSATASTSRMSWFSRRSSGKTTPVIEKPEEIEQLMDDYWMPKEIRSTLPPLVIAQDADEVFTPKELKATLPPLVIRTQELIEASHSATSTPQSKLSTTAEGDRDELIAAEIELEKAQAEVEAAKSEVAQARAAADAAAEAVAHHHHHHPISTTSPKEASDCIDTGLPAVDATELERAMMAAGPPASAGAGDLLDSKRDDDDDEDDDEAPVTALASPPFEDECTATVWHEDTPELQSPFADEIIRNLSSPGLASLTSSDATTSSPGAFVDAEENPWSG